MARKEGAVLVCTAEDRDRSLKAKFFSKWKQITMMNRPHIMKQVDPEWLRRVIFNPSSRTARQVACNMVENFCNTPERTRDMIDLTTSFLGDLGKAGESAAEFVALYKRLIRDDQWKYYLSVSISYHKRFIFLHTRASFPQRMIIHLYGSVESFKKLVGGSN